LRAAAETAVGFGHEPDARIARGLAPHHIRGAVGGPVVDDDELESGFALAQRPSRSPHRSSARRCRPGRSRSPLVLRHRSRLRAPPVRRALSLAFVLFSAAVRSMPE
jgi:hypothetical protein